MLHYSKKILSFKNSARKIWNILKVTGKLKNLYSNFNKKLSLDKREVPDTKQIPNEYNKYLTTIVPKLVSTILK